RPRATHAHISPRFRAMPGSVAPGVPAGKARNDGADRRISEGVCPLRYGGRMNQSASVDTKTDRAMEDRMNAFAGDAERVEVSARARAFKRSGIGLAEALAGVYERGSWERWGYGSFDAYCKGELSVTPATAAKLLGSFRFLRSAAPRVIERVRDEPAAP